MEREKTYKRIGSVGADPNNLEISKEAGREVQCTQGLSKNCTNRESVSLLSHVIRGFRNKCHWSLNTPWEDRCEWHNRMARITGSDCAVMYNLINTHINTYTQETPDEL